MNDIGKFVGLMLVAGLIITIIFLLVILAKIAINF